MKILTAMYTLRKGGAYDRFLMMVEALLERGCEVHCLSLVPVPVKHPSYLNHMMFFPFQGNGWMARPVVLLFFPFYGLFMGWRKKIDLYVAFGSLYAFILAIPKWILKRPMVTLIRGDSTFGLKTQNSPGFFLCLNKMIEYFGLRCSDRIITNNRAFQDEIAKRLGSKKPVAIELLFNNIPAVPDLNFENRSQIRAQFGIPMEARILVTAGILNRGKNIETLLKCLPRIGIANLFLLIIGEGTTKADHEYLGDLKRLVRTLELDSKVIFTGWVQHEKLWGIFGAADLFVLPSKKEGMPNVILEALGIDLPCLGSNIPGINDILHHEKLLFDPMDEEVIAQKIRQALSEGPFFEQMKKLCRERKKVFEFDWKEKIVQLVTMGFNRTDPRS